MHNHNHHNHNHDHHDYHHNHGAKDLTLKTRFVFTIFFNILISAAEFLGGFLSGSLALISDATHNLSDAIALIFGYLGEKVSEKKPDLEYSFGLRRFEVITAVVNAIALWAIGIFIIYEAVLRWTNPVQINLKLMIPIAVIGLAGNMASIFILGRGHKNMNARAAFLHLLYDAITSVIVIGTGVAVYFTGSLWVDPLVSIIISIFMIFSSYGILAEALRIFLQMAPKGIDTQDVFKSILETSGAIDVHGLHIWSVSSSEVFLSCHICMDQGRGVMDNDRIITRRNTMLQEKFGIAHTTIQVEAGRFCVNGSNGCCDLVL
ncbi:MAG: cation diffusion facilitator family transporter [Syntrophaceae bacterium]